MAAISGGPEKIWNKKQFLLHSPLQLKLWLVPKENKWWPKFTLLVFGLLLMEFSTATAEHTIDSRNVIEYKMMVSGNFIAACAMIVIVPWSGEKKNRITLRFWETAHLPSPRPLSQHFALKEK